MYPILRFLRSESPEMSFPSRKTCPDVGFSTPEAMFNRVLFPLPERPIMVTNSPCSNVRDT